MGIPSLTYELREEIENNYYRAIKEPQKTNRKLFQRVYHLMKPPNQTSVAKMELDCEGEGPILLRVLVETSQLFQILIMGQIEF
ncbi:hypothetical protein CEXT_800191 [Caerostris extrusa]|uniref:Uncharacterized protein n=1 Tax=Caerostris extrusa TaxID=172846 RepID=A0AAV4XQS3_CAEEX|nr:hypothetical protein CEXT_800191 [Caerostris extrusa]